MAWPRRAPLEGDELPTPLRPKRPAGLRCTLLRVHSRLKQAFQRRRRAALVDLVGLAARPLRRSRPDDPYHAVFADFVAAANELGDYRVLELGARGTHVDPRLHGYREYVGLDVHPGPNVDVVGDAHRLSELVDAPFDAVYSISTFEHLAMPWKVVLEINRVLRDGGLVFTATHHSWPPHELPWDYWRYSRGAFQAIFNAHTGFELIRVEEGLPGLIVPMTDEPATRGMHRNPSPLAVSALARKIGPPRAGLSWDLAAADVADGSYPRPSETAHEVLPRAGQEKEHS
jgi:SAM-dependent methyltransferase